MDRIKDIAMPKFSPLRSAVGAPPGEVREKILHADRSRDRAVRSPDATIKAINALD
jgi:hypothetical protein